MMIGHLTGLRFVMTQSGAPDRILSSMQDKPLDVMAADLRNSGLIHRLIRLAHDEDLGPTSHDWTGELMFDRNQSSEAKLVLRQFGTISGLEFVPDILKVFVRPSENVIWTPQHKDGEWSSSGTVLGTLNGSSIAIVRLERTLLNLVSRLSGIATRTHQFVDLVQGTNVQICDTRKTTPGLRVFEKYAVRCGGGVSHRMGLHDALLVKDNHLAGLSEEQFCDRVRSASAHAQEQQLKFVQVEVDTLDQLSWLLSIEQGAVDIALLDNMKPETLLQAVMMRNELNPELLLEASGGINETTLGPIAETGIDRISIGGLTHQAVSLDIGLDTL
jgi:nicotinate-nucleotide pyrophosphorylase (carboxylating)